MRVRAALLALLLVAGYGVRYAIQWPPPSTEDKTFLSMDTTGRAEEIANSSPARKFELLLLQWDEYTPHRSDLTGELFAEYFPELRGLFLDYLSAPDPDPEVLNAICDLLWMVDWTSEYDVRSDAQLEQQFAAAVSRVPEDRGFVDSGGLSDLWPDTFAEYDAAAEERWENLHSTRQVVIAWLVVVAVVAVLVESCLLVALRGSIHALSDWMAAVFTVAAVGHYIAHGLEGGQFGAAKAIAEWFALFGPVVVALVMLCAGCWEIRKVRSAFRRQFALLLVTLVTGAAFVGLNTVAMNLVLPGGGIY